MIKVIMFTDFDGTVTSREGRKTVFTPFYASLLQPAMYYDYKFNYMKNRAEVQAAFKAKFGEFSSKFDYTQEDADLLMGAESIHFFHEILKYDEVSINVVTKNRADYIIELLKYQGFSLEEINKIKIMDSGKKKDEVYFHLKAMPESVDKIFILDDSSEDLMHMVQGARAADYTDNEIISFGEEAGQFKWLSYEQAVKEIIKQDTPALTKEEKLSPSINRETFFAKIIASRNKIDDAKSGLMRN